MFPKHRKVKGTIHRIITLSGHRLSYWLLHCNGRVMFWCLQTRGDWFPQPIYQTCLFCSGTSHNCCNSAKITPKNNKIPCVSARMQSLWLQLQFSNILCNSSWHTWCYQTIWQYWINNNCIWVKVNIYVYHNSDLLCTFVFNTGNWKFPHVKKGLLGS